VVRPLRPDLQVCCFARLPMSRGRTSKALVASDCLEPRAQGACEKRPAQMQLASCLVADPRQAGITAGWDAPHALLLLLPSLAAGPAHRATASGGLRLPLDVFHIHQACKQILPGRQWSCAPLRHFVWPRSGHACIKLQ